MVVIEQALETLFANIGVTYGDWLLIAIILGSLIMFGTGLRIGLMVSTFLLAGGYVMFSLMGFQTFNILIVLLISIVLLSISILLGRGSGGLA